MAAQIPLNSFAMRPLPLNETWQQRWRDPVSYATSSSQENGSAERNAQREREQRNRTARFQSINDSNPMQPLFKEPIKVDHSEDEISRRIQSTLGDFQSVKHFITSENLIGISSNPPPNGLYSQHSNHYSHHSSSSGHHRSSSYGHPHSSSKTGAGASSREWKQHHKAAAVTAAPDHTKESPLLPTATAASHTSLLEDLPPLTNGLAKSASSALLSDVPQSKDSKDPIENILQAMKVEMPPLISEIPSPEKKEPPKEIYSFNSQDQLLDQLDYLLEEEETSRPEESSVFQPMLLEPLDPPKSDKILGEDLLVSDSEDEQQPPPPQPPPREATPPPPQLSVLPEVVVQPPPQIKLEEVEELAGSKPTHSPPTSESSSAESEESSSGSESDEELPPPSKPAPQGWNLANFLDPTSPPATAALLEEEEETAAPPPPPPTTTSSNNSKRKRGSSPPPPAVEAPPRTKRTKLQQQPTKRVASPVPVSTVPAPAERLPVAPETGAIWITIDLRLLDSLPPALQGKVPGWKPFCLVPNISVEEASSDHRTSSKYRKADSRKKHSSQAQRPSQASSPWPRPCDFLLENPRAKPQDQQQHQQATVEGGPQQVLNYFDAIHQFIQRGASMETAGEQIETDKLYALYKDTLTLLRYVDSKYLREEPVPLSVLSYKCQAYLHYKLYLLRRGDVSDMINKTVELQKQFRIPLVGASSSSPALPRSPHSPTPSPAGSVGSQSSGYSSSELSRQSGGVPDVYYTYVLRINHFLQHVHQATGFWEHAQDTYQALSPPDKELMREVGPPQPTELCNFPLRELVGYMSTLLSRLRARLLQQHTS